MSRARDYLRVPEDYVVCLDRLHWSEAGDAIETASGATFALTQEIALFLEGFASRRPLIHFGHILHLLHMLKRGGSFAALRHAYEATDHPARNAGAFCAQLCTKVPPLADPPFVQQIWHALMSSHYVIALTDPKAALAPGTTSELPPLGPLTFEGRLLHALAAYQDDEIEHWFRHGQGPVKADGEAIARTVMEQRPRSLQGVLASLAQRDRLAGAIPFVAQLVSALALPPRRLSPPELPIGGYADVANRGQPEQVLPSQLAVDELEFIRRFAENELLYFRREEPHSRLREELVILLDQGVRTWGVVRLVLGAAFFAFGKMALRRHLPFQVATTGTDGRLSDPVQTDEAALGEMLDASDLSPNPGLALEAVLEKQSGPACDAVLLTHPRNLNEAEVQVAARRVAPGTRLFAVAVDEHGIVELSELRHGTPISLTRFRVDLSQRVPEPRAAKPAALLEATSALPWGGDVEPIGYPFRFGLPHPMLAGCFDFDESGKWILAACERGMLFASRTDGSATEILPRGMCDGQLLMKPEALLGVRGGFVVAGRIDKELIAFHYDLAERACRRHRLGTFTGLPWRMAYSSSAHSIVVHQRALVKGVDLGTGEFFSNERKPVDPVTRLQRACNSWIPGRRMVVFDASHDPADYGTIHALALNSQTGELILHAPGWNNFTPLADGQPELRGAVLHGACCQGHTLAVYCQTAHQSGRWRLYVYRGPEGKPLYESQHIRDDIEFTLSRDGNLLAERYKHGALEIRDLASGSAPVRLMPRGKFRNNLAVRLGQRELLVSVGKYRHLIDWTNDRLEHQLFLQSGDCQRRARYSNLELSLSTSMRLNPDIHRLLTLLRSDPNRFNIKWDGDLILLVDRFGQIALHDRLGNLVCMFFVFRSQFAAWMPDGTRYGPAALTGGPETPGAAERIAQRLQQAWKLGEEMSQGRTGCRVEGGT
jgi:hypothetical protein